MRSTLLPLAATLAIQALVAMATITVPVLAPAASSELHLSAGLIGLYVSLVYLGSMISSAASADLIRRFGAILFGRSEMVPPRTSTGRTDRRRAI